MRVSSLLLAALVAVPGTVVAQGGPQGRGMFSAFVMEAPPEADSAATLWHLTADQRAQYTALRRDFLAKTGASRDSLRAMREGMRSGGGMGGGGAGREGMRERMQALQQESRAFEQSLVKMLTPEQSKAFDDWKAAQAQQRRMNRPAGMGGSPQRS